MLDSSRQQLAPEVISARRTHAKSVTFKPCDHAYQSEPPRARAGDVGQGTPVEAYSRRDAGEATPGARIRLGPRLYLRAPAARPAFSSAGPTPTWRRRRSAPRPTPLATTAGTMRNASEKALVVIPTLMLDASFSAPLAWMFSYHRERVEGIYGFELTIDKARAHERFIVELNWFVELHEFGLLVNFLRTHNPEAEILFGGMYASINPDEIFRRYPVDLFIQGDNEKPIQHYLEGRPPREIPNFQGRGFRNPISYIFAEEDYLDLDLNLDWFPSYFHYRDRSNYFLAPHIITAKGGCNAAHAGCEHCMGSQYGRLKEIYGRPPIAMSQRSLFHLLHNAEKRFKEASLYITRADHYDFSGENFNLDVTIEIDSPVSMSQVAAILSAFPKVFLLLPVYTEGIVGRTLEAARYADLIRLEDADHLIRFYVLHNDVAAASIPRDHLIFSEFAYPKTASFSYYANIEAAIELSQRFYSTCGRHFVDGHPRPGARNPNFYLQLMRFSQDFR